MIYLIIVLIALCILYVSISRELKKFEDSNRH